MDLPADFGPYVLERFLAAGGMAEVYVAHKKDDPRGPKVCVKRVLPGFSQSPDFVTMFKDEAYLASKLQHDNIVRVFDSGQIDGTLFMAMELVDGLDLGKLMRRLVERKEQLTVPQALVVGIAMCRGLHHAHTAQAMGKPLELVHRDISPHNILVDKSGQVKVMDFGIARATGRLTHTQTGVVKGKVSYMAPEQALGETLDHRVDQFAAAIVLWEILCTRRLFGDATDILKFDKILNKPSPAPSTVRRDVPPQLDAIVLKALEKKPYQRYPDMAHFERALTDVLMTYPNWQQEGDLRPVVARVTEDTGATDRKGIFDSQSGQNADSRARTSSSLGTAQAPPPKHSDPQATKAERTPSSPGLEASFAPQGTNASSPAASRNTGRSGGLKVVGAGDPMPTSTAMAGPPTSTATTGVTSGSMTNQSLTDLSNAAARRMEREERAVPGAAARGGTSKGMMAALVGGGIVVGLVLGAVFFGGEKNPCVPLAKGESIALAARMLDVADAKLLEHNPKAALDSIHRSLQMHGSARGYVKLGRLQVERGDFWLAMGNFRCAIQNEPEAQESIDIKNQMLEAIGMGPAQGDDAADDDEG